MDAHGRYIEASVHTADNLRTIAQSVMIRDLSRLSLPEIDAAVDIVARMVPAGNVPGVILNGLARLSARKPPLETVKRDIHLLFKGVEQVLDRAVYGAFFAGPAAIIWGYQNLLKLAGKEPEDSFPDGVWQFYVDYALREDTARHANETSGFDALLNRHRIQLDRVDRVTAWVMAAIHCLHQYDALLENEWRERACTRLLCEVTCGEPDAALYASLYAKWQEQRPYGRRSDARPEETYAAYRRARFEAFLSTATSGLRDDLRRKWVRQLHLAEAQELPAYQRQMSILAYLEPGLYGETHVLVPLAQAHVGLVHRGRYYLISACLPGTDRPADVHEVRALVTALMAGQDPSPRPPLDLARIQRSAWPRLRGQLRPALVHELDALRNAPILFNSDSRLPRLPLAELRQAERGIGDHALTILDTGETFVLDQSHIFFDGAWGAALAEILTNEALSWAIYLHTCPPAQPARTPPRMLDWTLLPSERELTDRAPRVSPEESAETEVVNLKAMLTLRKLFKQRSDLLRLTVNDLLVIYRAIHAATYQLSPDLAAELRDLTHQNTTRKAAAAALETIDRSRETSPAILVPVDASGRSPRDRLYPMTFQAPLADLDLLRLHEQTLQALAAYRRAAGDRVALYAEFDRLQRTYLATLAGLGEVLSKAKELALRGESASVGTIKLLAHMPTPLQHMLDEIPGRFDLLNDIVKGREVFSNVGAVAPTSTLVRFITAKDDNDQKILAWGVITDAAGVMRITLRDFRPHVSLLRACGCRKLAARLTQDYLDAYGRGLNGFVRDLIHIALASRETRLPGQEKSDA